jgi:hypothetical protein
MQLLHVPAQTVELGKGLAAQGSIVQHPAASLLVVQTLLADSHGLDGKAAAAAGWQADAAEDALAWLESVGIAANPLLVLGFAQSRSGNRSNLKK